MNLSGNSNNDVSRVAPLGQKQNGLRDYFSRAHTGISVNPVPFIAPFLLAFLFVVQASRAATESPYEVGPVQTASAASADPFSTSAPFADFKQFLSWRPHIKFFSVSKSWAPQNTNFSTIEGSLQPDTFYLKETVKVSGAPGEPVMTRVLGQSRDSIWRILRAGQVQRVMLDRTNDTAIGTEFEQSIKEEQEEVARLCRPFFNLGLIFLDRGSLRWKDATHFEGTAYEGPWKKDRFPGLGKVFGELVGQQPDKPDSMRYVYSGYPDDEYTAKYTYGRGEHPAFLPEAIEVWVTTSKGSRKITGLNTKIRLARLVVGTVEGKPNGFEFADFSEPSHVTNSGLVTVSGNVGTIVVGGETNSVYAKGAIRHPSLNPWIYRGFFFTIVVFSVCLVVWQMLRPQTGSLNHDGTPNSKQQRKG